MDSRPLKITEKFHRRDGRSFELATNHGWLETVYRPHLDEYLLSNIQSTKPRQGIGKFLLRASVDHAVELGAGHITAMIISRECLDDMMTVFGQDNVEVERVGEYHENVYSNDDDASALLYFPLNDRVDTSIYAKFYQR